MISLLTSSGAVIEHEIPVAVETPAADAGFFGLMALLGTYVGIIPVVLGMLLLPAMRRLHERWVRVDARLHGRAARLPGRRRSSRGA